ncbi:MAG: NIPSNAP family protein, partial [Candidatus Binatia bacterium]
MIYEWRTYEAMPGKFPALHTHLKVAAGLFQKHGLGVLGYWTEEIGTAFQVSY